MLLFGSVRHPRANRARHPQRDGWQLGGERSNNVEDAVAQMLPESHEIVRPHALREDKQEEWFVGLGGVAALARQDEVVTPVVRRLPLSRRDMVERDVSRIRRYTAVGAGGAVQPQEPNTSLGVGLSTGGDGGVLLCNVFRGASPRAAAPVLWWICHVHVQDTRSLPEAGGPHEKTIRRPERQR